MTKTRIDRIRTEQCSVGYRQQRLERINSKQHNHITDASVVSTFFFVYIRTFVAAANLIRQGSN